MMKRLIISLIALPLLSACGFTPLHTPAAGFNGASFGDVSIEVTDGRDAGDKEVGFYVMQRLRDRIGENTGKHILRLEPSLSRGRIGLSADDVASRYDSRLNIKYSLVDAKNGGLLTSGSVLSVSTFGAPLDPYGLVAADKNAVQQVAKETADRLLVKLAGYYADPAK